MNARPPLFIVSGPSGAGKGTALDWMVRSGLVRRVPTYTTRPPRLTERDGVEYNFVTDEAFAKLREEGQLIEYTRTYADSYYAGRRVSCCTARIRPPWPPSWSRPDTSRSARCPRGA